eukprot:scaffold1795_cov236-Chaetoceros_neogracile.AAC.2
MRYNWQINFCELQLTATSRIFCAAVGGPTTSNTLVCSYFNVKLKFKLSQFVLALECLVEVRGPNGGMTGKVKGDVEVMCLPSAGGSKII